MPHTYQQPLPRASLVCSLARSALWRLGIGLTPIALLPPPPPLQTVAKSFKGPIKFLFKKPGCDIAEKGAECLSLLGLGDVVLPGIFIALIIRFDDQRKPGSRFYFYCVLVAYRT